MIRYTDIAAIYQYLQYIKVSLVYVQYTQFSVKHAIAMPGTKKCFCSATVINVMVNCN